VADVVAGIRASAADRLARPASQAVSIFRRSPARSGASSPSTPTDS